MKTIDFWSLVLTCSTATAIVTNAHAPSSLHLAKSTPHMVILFSSPIKLDLTGNNAEVSACESIS